MKKRGFTLAEVLITLGIVGVVAALTAPSLVLSSRNEANAARLSVVVSNLENAFSSAIAKEGADNLYGTSMWSLIENGQRLEAASQASDRAAFVGRLGQYMIVNGFQDSDAAFYGSISTCPMTANGGTNNDQCNNTNSQRFGGAGQMFPIELKNGATVFIRAYRHSNDDIATNKTQAMNAGSTYYTNAADIVIDVNGKNGPNTLGRDLFWFELGENGVMYPVGGRDVASAGAWVDGSGWSEGRWDQAGQQASCLDDDKGNDPRVAGIGCTGRVIAEGYKINY